MQLSAKLNNDIVALIERNRALGAEIDKNMPGRYANSPTQDAEVNRRRDLCDKLGAEITANETELTRLRKAAAAAREAEKNPAPVVSERLQKLYDHRDIQARELELASEIFAQKSLAAIEGDDKKSREARDSAFERQANAILELRGLKYAIEQAEQREQEEREEFQRRAADTVFAAAQRAAEDAVAHDHATDVMMRALADHLAQRPALLRAIRKTGCQLDDARMNTLQTVEILHRAAKAAGLAPHLGISIRDAVPLESASTTILKLAIRRPEVKSAAA
jgi:hypothetical protein